MQINCKYEKLVPAETLVPHEMNANKHPARQIEMLAKILKYQGWRHPIVVSKLSGKIVAGHGRLDAAKANGWTEVPVDMQDFDDKAQELAFLASDNKIQELAETDDDAMIALIKATDIDDLELFGLDDFELPKDDQEQRDEIEDEVPEVTESISRMGDIYELGSHRLVCGDSTDAAVVATLMNGEKADMVFTDPPYGVSIKNTKGDIMGDDSLDIFKGCLPRLREFSKESAHIYIYFGVQYTKECLSMMGEHFKQNNVLVQKITHENKPSPDGYFKSNYEMCYFSNPSGRPFNHGHADVSETTLKDSRYKGDGKMKTYPALTEQKATEHNLKSVHPTQKTVAICEFYQKISSNEYESVLDLFGGSGSTLIACEKTKRKCYMMELDPHYIDVIVSRYVKYTGNTSIKRNGEPMEWTLGQEERN